MTQYDPLYLPPQYKKAGGQQDGEHGWVQHVKGEQYQKKILSVFVIVSGPVSNPESSSVHKISPKSINQSPDSKFLGLYLSTRVWLWEQIALLCYVLYNKRWLLIVAQYSYETSIAGQSRAARLGQYRNSETQTGASYSLQRQPGQIFLSGIQMNTAKGQLHSEWNVPVLSGCLSQENEDVIVKHKLFKILLKVSYFRPKM